ncbi:MAG: hypothetical protein ABIH76_08025, partial [Candidatus Bathyarchaeota archaeon]
IKSYPYGLIARIQLKNTKYQTRIFCDKIEYVHKREKIMNWNNFSHQLKFWQEDNLFFQINLKRTKRYKSIEEAMEDVGIVLS